MNNRVAFIILITLVTLLCSGCATIDYVKKRRPNDLNPPAVDAVMAFVEQFEGSFSHYVEIPGWGTWDINLKNGKRDLVEMTYSTELFTAKRIGYGGHYKHNLTFMDEHTRPLVFPERYFPKKFELDAEGKVKAVVDEEWLDAVNQSIARMRSEKSES